MNQTAAIEKGQDRSRCRRPVRTPQLLSSAGTDKRSARVGGYRILFLILENKLLVADIESRGQVYRRI